MNKLLKMVALSALVATPLVSHADEGLTRAQVRAQLAAVEAAGYNPNDGYHYPANIQRAEAIVAQQNNGASAFGSNASGSAQAGK